MDVPLYLRVWEDSPPIGPIGFLRKGVEVQVTGRSGDFTEIWTKFPTPAPWILSDLNFKNETIRHKRLTALVPNRSVPQDLSKVGPIDQTDWGYYRPLHWRPNGQQFSIVLCGRVRALESRDYHVLVAAEYPDGELWGWMDKRAKWEFTPGERGDDSGCKGPVPEGKPTDFRFPETWKFEQRPLEKRMNIGDEFYFLRPDSKSGQAICQKARIAKNTYSTGLLVHRLSDDGSIRDTRHFHRKGNRASVVEAYHLEPNGKLRTSCGCAGDNWRAVSEDGNSIGFLDDGVTDEERKSKVYYYHPQALRWWDRSPEKCLERLTELQDAFDVH